MAWRMANAATLTGVLAVGAVILAGCQTSPPEPEEPVGEEVEDTAAPPEPPKTFFLPTNCLDILPPDVFQELTREPIVLLRGPGSGSPDPVYPDGSPQEELGGLSCFFGDPEETMTYTLSIAPVTQENRATVIDGLLEQKFNVDQTPEGVLIYSILGDEISTPATYNTLDKDAWFEVLVVPGGRIPFEEGQRLAQSMRLHTYR